MAGLRSKISKHLPRAVVPYGRRAMRRCDQILGSLSSGRRPGVVLMLHVGRCGSTVLANLLAQNPEIYWDGKLHRKAKNLYGDRVRGLDHTQWTRRQFSISGARHYGFEFKFLPDQYPAILGMTTQDFLEQCKSIGVTHYILLTRRNNLRHVVSHYASQSRGNWHLSNTDSVHQQTFNIDIDHISTGSGPGRSLLQYLQEVEDAHEAVAEFLHDQNVLEIEYETDIDSKGAVFAYNKICSFLDLNPVSVRIKNRRVNPFPMRDTVSNYEDIVQRLKGTKFEWMLEKEVRELTLPPGFDPF